MLAAYTLSRTGYFFKIRLPMLLPLESPSPSQCLFMSVFFAHSFSLPFPTPQSNPSCSVLLSASGESCQWYPAQNNIPNKTKASCLLCSPIWCPVFMARTSFRDWCCCHHCPAKIQKLSGTLLTHGHTQKRAGLSETDEKEVAEDDKWRRRRSWPRLAVG